MSLHKKHYVKNWEHYKPEQRTTITIAGAKAAAIKPERINYITEDVAYWRKANHIHKYFVDNYNDGDDNNGEIYIGDIDNLKKLLDVVNEVLAASELIAGAVTNGYRYEGGEKKPIIESGKVIKDNTIAMKLLPTEEGFFFGSTEYDEYYIDDLEYTKKMIEEELALGDTGAEYIYHASW